MTTNVVSLDAYRNRNQTATPAADHQSPRAAHPAFASLQRAARRQLIEERAQRSFGVGLGVVLSGLGVFVVHTVIDGQHSWLNVAVAGLVAAGVAVIAVGIRVRDRALRELTGKDAR